MYTYLHIACQLKYICPAHETLPLFLKTQGQLSITHMLAKCNRG